MLTLGNSKSINGYVCFLWEWATHNTILCYYHLSCECKLGWEMTGLFSLRVIGWGITCSENTNQMVSP